MVFDQAVHPPAVQTSQHSITPAIVEGMELGNTHWNADPLSCTQQNPRIVMHMGMHRRVPTGTHDFIQTAMKTHATPQQDDFATKSDNFIIQFPWLTT